MVKVIMKESPILFKLFLMIVLAAPASAQTPSTTSAQLTRPRTVSLTPQQQPITKTATPQPTPATPVASPTTVATPLPVAKPSIAPGGSSAPPSTSTTQTPVAPLIVPSVSNPVSNAAWLPPIRPLSFDKARTRIAEAKRLFRTRPQLTTYTASTAPVGPTAGSNTLPTTTPTTMPTAAPNPALYFVTLAAADAESGQIHLLTVPKQTFLTPNAEVGLTTSLGAQVRLRVLRPNYVNTAVAIFDNTGRSLAPLVVEYPIEKYGRFREIAYYTSAHPALLTPEVVKSGQAYVRTMLDLAAKRLRDKGVLISPQIIDIAERLCVVEHTDHDRFRRENRRTLYEEVFALYSLNELDTYRYSVSTAGAGGMVQMIPWAYQMLRQRHPGVGLNPDFVLGMRNHGNALEAMLLYMQGTWNDLVRNPDITEALATGTATQAELVAAGYNSNAARLPSYIRRGGDAWRTLIPRETQMYLQIYKSLESLVPIKARG